MIPGVNERAAVSAGIGRKGDAPYLWTCRIPPRVPAPAGSALEVLKRFRGNASHSAHRMVAAEYESLWRPLPRLSTPLPVVAWVHVRGRAPASGTPVNGLTWQVDRDGLLLHLRLPENSWLPALLTMRMQVRIGISLPRASGRVVASGVALWAEAFQPFEATKLGIAFTEISEQDRKRIRRLVAAERRLQDFQEELRRHREPGPGSAWAAASNP